MVGNLKVLSEIYEALPPPGKSEFPPLVAKLTQLQLVQVESESFGVVASSHFSCSTRVKSSRRKLPLKSESMTRLATTLESGLLSVPYTVR
jgi:hypothetical protein